MSPEEQHRLATVIAERVVDRLARRKRLLSRTELAETLGCSIPTVDRMIREKSIPVIRFGRRPLFDPDGVLDALKRIGTENLASGGQV